MAQNSKIEWTDHTVNPWWGCAKVHTGCKNCYAEALSNRYGNNIWGETAQRKRIKSAFRDLKKYQAEAKKSNIMRKVFIGSMMDIFELSKPVTNPTDEFPSINWIRRVLFAQIDEGYYNNLIFLFLTKRPENILPISPQEWTYTAPKNVWFGTSISDQKTADKYVQELKAVKSANIFLSIILWMLCG